MRDYDDSRPPEEIQHDIDRTRAEVSSTIDAIQSKLTPGQLMDQAVSYARTSLPADFGANLGNTIRDNPVPVALMGIGIAWLMMAGQRSDGRARSRRQAADYDEEIYGRESAMAYDGTDYTSATASGASSEGAMHRAAAKAGETGRNLKDKAGELGQRISDTTSSVTGRAQEITGRAQEMTRNARGRMSESAGNARARMGELSQRSQQQYYRAKDSFGQMLDEQPLVLGALGVAIGAALGAAFPNTRREDELMGRTRDDLLESAKETARGQAEAVKESAQRVAQAAKQEIDERAGDASRTQAQGNGHTSRPGASDNADTLKAGSVPPGQGLH